LRAFLTAIAMAAALVLTAPLSAPAAAQDSLRIAAVVNDEVITGLDLAVRTRMAMLSAQLPDTPEMRNRAARQVLRTMIDERLMLQEATRQNIAVQQSEIDAELTHLAERNGVTVEQFGQYLQQNGVLMEPLTDQLRATIAWAKLVNRQLRPRAVVTEEDVDEVLRQAEENRGQPQRRVSEIFLAVGQASEEEEIRRGAERLIEQIRGGIPFSAIANQFSDSATAAVGGDVGWVLPGQLPAEVEEALSSMSEGEIAGPIRAAGGYYILQLRGQRSMALDAEPDREEVRRVLVNQRLDLLARRYLRDLRRDAFVEIRV
jgi:peptidyl-prolyl cis-trans isomerase SurA